MFTDHGLKVLHYQMWDYIVNKIHEYKRVINIVEAKSKFLESQKIDVDSIPYACPMCQYNKQHSSFDCIPCSHCPSCLKVNNVRGCLSGLFGLCMRTDDYQVQLTLALLIRDSWR